MRPNNELTPDEIAELADWFAAFFRYLVVDKNMCKLWRDNPFRAIEQYKDYLKLQEQQKGNKQ